MKFPLVAFALIASLSVAEAAFGSDVSELSRREQLLALNTIAVSALTVADTTGAQISTVEATGFTAALCLDLGKVSSLVALFPKYTGSNVELVTLAAQTSGAIQALESECDSAPKKVGKQAALAMQSIWADLGSKLALFDLNVRKELATY